MDNFKNYVSVILSRLDEYHYCDEVTRASKQCFSELEKYLVENHITYSPEIADEWFVIMTAMSLPKTVIQHYRNSLLRLKFLYEGKIGKFNFSFKKNRFIQAELEKELIEYLENLQGKLSAETIKNQKCCIHHFFYLIRQYDIKSISDISYEMLDRIQDDESVSEISKMHVSTYVRELLEYRYGKGRVSFGISIYLHYVRVGGTELITGVDESYHQKIRKYFSDEENKTYSSDILVEFRSYLNDFYSDHGYDKSTRSGVLRPVDLFILFLERNHYSYSPEISWVWYEKVKEVGIGISQFKRSLCLLEHYVLTGEFAGRTVFRSKKSAFNYIPEWSKEAANKYVNMKINEGWAQSTMDMIRSSITRFCNSLDHQGVRSFKEVNEEHIKQFDLEDKHKTAYGKNAYNARIRKFLIFLGEKGYINNPMLFVSLTAKSAPQEPVVVVLTEAELTQLNNVFKSEESDVSLRKKAVLLLGLRMGMRASDIVNLKWTDINWKENSIRFIQKKTQVEVILPMPVSVGNALYRYIVEERYHTETPYVFISERAPHAGLRSSACYRAIHSALPERNVDGSGFHVTRKTYATSLLRAGVGANMVAEALGQNSLNSVHRYLSLDGERMKECALTFKQNGIDGW